MTLREKVASVLLTNKGLAKIKTKAMRKGVWFRLLSRADRAVLDLTIRCVEKVRSRVLAKTISTIIGKILTTLENGFMQKAEEMGRKLVVSLSNTAEKWGNNSAHLWVHDRKFIRFLGVNTLDT